MGICRFAAWTIAAGLWGVSGALAAPILHVHDGAGNLGTVDVADGSVDVIGNMGVVMTDIAFDPDGNLFGLSFTSLYRIDRNTGATTLIGAHGIAGGNALVFGLDGTLYGAGNSTTSLFTVDTATGAGTNIGNIGFASAGDLAFNGGELYLASSSDDLILIDLDGGATGTLIGDFGFSGVFGLATAENGVLYGVAGTQVFSVDVATGAGTLASNFGAQGIGAAFGTSFFTEAGAPPPGGTPVSEPGALAFLGAGFVALAALRRRREAAP